MTWQPGEFDDLAEELRRRVAAEFRTEAEEVEGLVELQRRRRATIKDVATSAMHQGQQVTIRGPGGEWAGELQAIGADYLSLRTATLLVEARLDSIAIGMASAREGGHAAKPSSETFKARLGEFGETGEEVTIRCGSPDLEMTGIVTVVAIDHIEIRRSGERWIVPIDSVDLVLRPRLG